MTAPALKLVEKPCTVCTGNGILQASTTGELLLCGCISIKEYDKYTNYIRIKNLYEKSNIPVHYRTARVENLQVEHDDSKSLLSAVDTISDFLNAKELTHRGFYLCGNTGSGKTHLACSILNELTINRGIETRYVKVSKDFIEAIKATFGQKNGWGEPVNAAIKIESDLQKVPVLVLDDFGTQKDSEWALERIYDLIDARYENRRLTIITSNKPIKDWKSEDNISKQRIYSRLCGMTEEIPFEAPDWRERENKPA